MFRHPDGQRRPCRMPAPASALVQRNSFRVAMTSGISTICRDVTPASADPRRLLPHPPHQDGRGCFTRSGVPDQARAELRVPGLLPRDLPLSGFARRLGYGVPGRSSPEGGRDEFPEFRDNRRLSCSFSDRNRSFSARTSASSARNWTTTAISSSTEDEDGRLPDTQR